MNFKLFFAKRKFLARRALIYKQLAFALARGASPREEFDALLNNAKRRKSALEPIYQEWSDRLSGKAAGKMALAMQTTIPPSEYALLASAEETGNFKEGLDFMAHSVTQIEEMRQAISRAFKTILLPAIMLLSLVWATDAYFFPMVEESLPRKSWPFMTKLVAGIAHDIGSIVASAVVALPALLIFWFYQLPRWTGKWRVIAEKTLLFNKYRDYMCCLFLVNLQFLMEANHPPKESLERMLAQSNKYMQWHINMMLNQIVSRSINVGEAIQSTGLFKSELAELMSNYARWADWHQQIGGIATSSLELVTSDIKHLGPRIQAWLQLIVGLCLLIVFGAGAVAMMKVLVVGIS